MPRSLLERALWRWEMTMLQLGWKRGANCINSDTGEHISNEKNELQYIPFPVCNETGKPLELAYGIEDGNCPLLSFLILLSAKHLGAEPC